MLETPTLRSRRRALQALAAAALLLAAALPAAAAVETRVVTRAFPAGSEPFRLANLAGRVRLVNTSADEIRVKATAHAEGRDAAETRALLDAVGFVRDPERRGGWAIAYPVDRHRTYRYAEGESFGWFGSHSTTKYLGRRVTISGRPRGSAPTLYVDLEIAFPARPGLDLDQAVGKVTGGGLYGDLRIDTGSGDVELGAFNGRLVVDTGSGDVEVASLRGEGNLDTGSGDVVVSGLDAEELRADTGSGNVTLRDGRVGELVVDTGSGDVEVIEVAVGTADLDTGSGDIRLVGSLAAASSIRADTGSGDVEIYGGPAASFRVVADQGSGDLRIGYADATLRRDGRKVVGAERGDGRTRIVIDTGSGNAVVSPAR